MAEIVTAFPDVQIAVADAGRLHLEQHLGARRLWRRRIDLLQGGVEIGNLETLHRFSPDIISCWPGVARHSRSVVRCLACADQWMMAGGELTRRYAAQFRHFVDAALVRPRAAGAEAAARGRRNRRRWFTHR